MYVCIYIYIYTHTRVTYITYNNDNNNNNNDNHSNDRVSTDVSCSGALCDATTSNADTAVCKKITRFLDEPLPCNPEAETALPPWFGTLKAYLSGGVFSQCSFTDTSSNDDVTDSHDQNKLTLLLTSSSEEGDRTKDDPNTRRATWWWQEWLWRW